MPFRDNRAVVITSPAALRPRRHRRHRRRCRRRASSRSHVRFIIQSAGRIRNFSLLPHYAPPRAPQFYAPVAAPAGASARIIAVIAARAATLLHHRLLLKAAVNGMRRSYVMVRPRGTRGFRCAERSRRGKRSERFCSSLPPPPPAAGKISRAAAGLLEHASNQASVFDAYRDRRKFKRGLGIASLRPSAVRALCSPAERAKSDLRALNGIPGSTVTLELSRSSRRNPFISATPFASDLVRERERARMLSRSAQKFLRDEFVERHAAVAFHPLARSALSLCLSLCPKFSRYSDSRHAAPPIGR